MLVKNRHQRFYMRTMKQLEVWEKKIIAARRRRASQIPHEFRIPYGAMPGEEITNVYEFPYSSGLFSPRELDITDSSVVDIVNRIKRRQWSAYEVIKAYSKRAAYAHQLTNCLSEMFFEQGTERAKQLDEYYNKTGRLMGPLHGVPVSLKDHHHVKGTTASIGFVKYTDEIAGHNSALVNMLLDMGAVLYCKSAVPTGMLAVETISPLYGTTTNPRNRNLTAGGSSGGEAALLAFGGSPIGIGSDIGGSIRIPCSYNGLYGLKGTANRFPMYGSRSSNPAQVFISAVNGPMARDLGSLEYFTKSVLNSNPEQYDYTSIPMCYRETRLQKKLSFAVICTDDYIRPVPAVQRALDTTISALKAAGHEIIEWKPVAAGEMYRHYKQLNSYDGGSALIDNLDGEPIVLESMKKKLEQVRDPSGSTIAEIQRRRKEVESLVFQQWRNTKNFTSTGKEIDGIISPATIYPAHTHNRIVYTGYTAYWNLMDYPCMAFPVITADKSLDKPGNNFFPSNKAELRAWKAHKLEDCENSPVGLQVITKRFEDEKAIELTKIIRGALEAANCCQVTQPIIKIPRLPAVIVNRKTALQALTE
ncbi:hypothetical protein TRVA0_023S01046 [Trichomonascus vanleenenianus]|uniref:uncharacterized protein n=1 Tax=Trichomonascus vanleenenianus TaxID=2268995 RepID=UPI003ECA73B6